ncbi:MAG: hypothetical protein QM655_16455 [Nocardioidaceae bacterium]
MTTAIEVDDLVVVRGATRAVDGVSFRTRPGEVGGHLLGHGAGDELVDGDLVPGGELADLVVD